MTRYVSLCLGRISTLAYPLSSIHSGGVFFENLAADQLSSRKGIVVISNKRTTFRSVKYYHTKRCLYPLPSFPLTYHQQSWILPRNNPLTTLLYSPFLPSTVQSRAYSTEVEQRPFTFFHHEKAISDQMLGCSESYFKEICAEYRPW